MKNGKMLIWKSDKPVTPGYRLATDAEKEEAMGELRKLTGDESKPNAEHAKELLLWAAEIVSSNPCILPITEAA